MPDPRVYSYTYTEDFSTDNYKDKFYTTGDWNTKEKKASLEFKDGKYLTEGMVQSLKVNETSEMITEAKIKVDDVSKGNMRLAYKLSADGEVHWSQVSPDSDNTFAYPGYDLRWKVSLWTNALNNMNSPIVNNITVSYNTVDIPISFLDVEYTFDNINVAKGSNDVELLKLKMTNNGEENFIFSGAQFSGTREGVSNIRENDLSNAYLYNENTKLRNAYINDNMKIIFSFDSIKINKGDSINLILK